MKEKVKKIYDIKYKINTNMAFVIYAKHDRLVRHLHAWKVWQTLKSFGCKVYVIAPDLKYFEGSKIYSDFEELEGKAEVVIPCLRVEFLDDLVDKTVKIGAKYIWFQENNWNCRLDEECREKGIGVIRGCVLKHKLHKKPLAYFHPCYWHGWKEKKVPSKYDRFAKCKILNGLSM